MKANLQEGLSHMVAKPTSNQISTFMKRLSDDEIIDVDFRFTDTSGRWHHMTFNVDGLSKDIFENGIAFDGSSIPGWRPIHNSDMSMIPDLSTVCRDPFACHPTLIVICDILDPDTGEGYDRDPRTTSRKAEAFLRSENLGTDAYFGPEPEFFIFDQINFDVREHHSFYEFQSEESPSCHSDGFGHRPNQGGGYAPCAPVDRMNDLRSHMLLALKQVGLGVIKHHHEVASSQHELGFEYDTLLKTGDNLQLFKYCIHNTCHKFGKTATFMPKPVAGDNGSGMHVHQSIWNGREPLFLGNGYSQLSEAALHYIGGILKHAKTLNAFTNPTTNSYKRLIPGFEAPVYRAYSAKNRSAAIRIPLSANDKAKRIEVRFPDPMANPYLSLSAMLMAGLDGIVNKIDPGAAIDENLYEQKHTNPNMLLSETLVESLRSLNKHHSFLLAGNVFTADQIQAYVDLKFEEVSFINQCPSPAEFKLYYSL